MIIYPAVDIKNGKCVRLIQGEFDKVTVFADDPVEMAANWANKGTKVLHVVDLDGAKDGKPGNIEAIKRIIESLDIKVQVGGGIRNEQAIELLIECGVNRVILGTAAVNQPEFIKKVLKKYNEKIVIGIDAKYGKVAINGWQDTSNFEAIDFAKMMEFLGAKTIIYTDIATDGMLKGPNFEAMEEMNNAVNIDVIASGGVTTIEDIIKLKQIGVAGAIVGKALYTGMLSFEDIQKSLK